MALHFIVVLVPQKRGDWCAHFPAIPGCRAMADNIERAIANSYREIIAKLERMNNVPRSEIEIRAHRAWAYARGINWSIAQTRQVQIAADDYAI